MIENVYKALSKRKSDDLLEPLRAAMILHGIDTKLRVANFMAQMAHESAGFTRLEENLNYSAEGLARVWPSRFKDKTTGMPNALALRLHRKPEMIANHVYANRMGNGDTASGEGWAFRGRGIIQLTGKTNYKHASQDLYNDLSLVDNPDLVKDDLSVSAMVAVWFWCKNDLNDLADKNDTVTISKRINGGIIGLEHRLELAELAEKVWEQNDGLA